MPITESRIEKCFETIRAICSSPNLVEYLIGRTSKSAQDKGDDYRRLKDDRGRPDGFDHLVFLADKLTDKEAEELEDKLQAWCGLGKDCPPDIDRREITCRKYSHHKNARRRSNGNSKRKEHSVYMVWWEK
jgi:hypothetical protein